MRALKNQFHNDMVNIYKTAWEELNYKASRFLDMVSKYGGYQAAIKLAKSEDGTYGFEVLWENKRLDLSVEALILQKRYRTLFNSDVIGICEKRLSDHECEITEEIEKDSAITAIPAIRIMPMSKSLEFEDYSIEDIQHGFFIDDLKNRDECLYYYAGKGLNAKEKTLILFQCDGMIIASARLEDVVKYEKDEDSEYSGALALDRESIEVFEPIFAEEIRELDESFKRFCQSKQYIDIECVDGLLKLIERKKSPAAAGEIGHAESDGITEGAKRSITVNAYERSPKARKACIDHFGASCQICGFDFGKIYGVEFGGRVHVHHITPLSEIGEEYEVDPVNDLIPVCPNCHMVIHSKLPAYTVDEVKKLIK